MANDGCCIVSLLIFAKFIHNGLRRFNKRLKSASAGVGGSVLTYLCIGGVCWSTLVFSLDVTSRRPAADCL